MRVVVTMAEDVGPGGAADLVLPHPQIHTFEVPAGAVHRICLASDGLWDVVKFEACAEVLRDAKSVAGASKALLKKAVDEYIENRNHDSMDDDTTVLVVELDPSGVSPPPASGGCCAVM